MNLRRRNLLLLASVVGVGACSAQGGMPGAPAAMAPPQANAAGDAMVPGMAPPPAEAAPAPPLSPVARAAPAAAPMAGDDRAMKMAADEPAPPLWAPVRQFRVPSYQGVQDGPRTDFRETVFWQPSVQTGEQGTARVEFYLSDAVTSFRATVEGVGRGGTAGRRRRGAGLEAACLAGGQAASRGLEW